MRSEPPSPVERLVPWLFWAAMGNLALFAVQVMLASPERQSVLLPDDAYYYLTLADQYLRHGVWTFDSGTTRTTGFHLLHGYLLVGLRAALGSHALLPAAVALSTGLTGAAAILAHRLAKHGGGTALLLATTLLATSLNVTYNAVAALEWAETVLLAGLLYAAVYGTPRRPIAPVWRAVAVAGLGALGSLARTEFLILPGAMLAAALYARFRDGGGAERSRLGRSLAATAGAAAGYALLSLHHLWVSGHLVQTSARVKLFWSLQAGPSPVPFGYQLLRLFAPIPRFFGHTPAGRWSLLGLAGLVVMLGAALLIRRRRSLADALGRLWRTPSQAPRLEPALASVVALLGLAGLYAFNSQGIQLWYTALALAPVTVLLWLALRPLYARAPRATLVVATLLCALNVVGTRVSRPFYRPQAGAVARGRFVAEALSGHRVAAWDAGVAGYYSGGRVINLDGLVNDAVVPYILKNDVAGYVLRERIDRLIQPPPRDRRKRRLLGLGPGLLARCVTPERVRFRGRSMTVYRVDARKLARLRKRVSGARR